MENSIFLLDNEPVYCHEIERYLSAFGYRVVTVASIEAAIRHIQLGLCATLLIGIDLLNFATPEQLRSLSEKIGNSAKVIVLTRHYDIEEEDGIVGTLVPRTVSTLYRNAPLSELRSFLPH